MPSTIKILYVFPATYFSPPWAVCSQIVRNLDHSMFETFVVLDTLGSGGVGLDDMPGARLLRLPLGSAIDRAKQGSLGGLIALCRSCARILGIVRSERIDIIHTTDDGTSLVLASMLALLTRRKLLVHYHTGPSLFSGLRLALTRFVGRLASANIAVSRFMVGELQPLGLRPKSLSYVLNAVSTTRFSPEVNGQRLRQEFGFAGSDVVVLQLSRVWQPKRQVDFIRALAIARQDAPQLRGLIVGWESPDYQGEFGSYRAKLEALATELGVRDAVTFSHARPESDQLHAASDIGILPSIGEPFGLVVIESMASGKPFIGTLSGGIPEILVDGETGFLVPVQSPERIAALLVRLAHDPALRERIGRSAREAVLASFSEPRLASEMGAIYTAVHTSAALPNHSTATRAE